MKKVEDKVKAKSEDVSKITNDQLEVITCLLYTSPSPRD